ncbi:hypothetical protein [Pseudomonas putida]|uniref:hypothetical protein n=1 Tax=Pseudomonas putida TaxID=303 RepID=UPI001575F1AF|nr:hypothetical protein [Pseudomonas putida]NTY91950.1 hypothetical protein [Pseudomonas putida]NTY99538.1 hypothetical protein [Pseudomonas putida]NTZ22071.1 hypothetical protein [Pseudomonas putida]NTZ55626.1 hypothetical protein [Pseudomonas putida]NTZ65547.1 hypothetical protein [Pseudomonas putida]
MKKVFVQLIKEFALPCAAAVAWTVYSLGGEPLTLVAGVTAFSSAFFLSSWLVGQVFRVRKQVGVEKSFGSVESRLVKLSNGLGDVEVRLEKLAESLESNVKKLVGHINGGDSFCCVMPNGQVNGIRQWHLRHCGDYPLFKFGARFVDIGDITKGIEETFRSDELSVGGGSILTCLPACDGEQSVNVFFQSRGGSFYQEIRFGMVEGRQVYAYRLAREYETLIQYLPEGFQLREEDRRDWLPEFGVTGTRKEWSIEYSFQEMCKETVEG